MSHLSMALSFSAFIAWSLTRCQPDQYTDTFKQVGSKDLHLPLDGVHLKTMSENPGTGCASIRGARKTTLLSEVFARQCCWRHEKDIFEGTETWKTPPTHPPTHSPVKQENAPWFRRLEGYSTLHMNHIINWHFSRQASYHCPLHLTCCPAEINKVQYFVHLWRPHPEI